MTIKTRMEDSRNWIMNNPESLTILMLMGTGMGFLFFGILSVAVGFAGNWFLVVLFGIFSLLSLKQFIKIVGIVKRTSLKEALGGISAGEFVWHKDKSGNKLYGGVDDGSNGCKSDEVCSESNAKENKRIREEVGHIYR